MHHSHRKSALALIIVGILHLSSGHVASAAMVNKPISYSTEARPLFEAISQLQVHLGASISLKGGANPSLTVQGEYSGNNGFELLGTLARRLKLEWAATDTEAFLAPAGTRTTEKIPVGNAELANAVARNLREQFKNRGSNIAVSAAGNDLNVSGLSWWIAAVKNDVINRVINESRKDLIQNLTVRAPSSMATVQPRDISISPPDPTGMSLMIFKLKNAWAEDKTANVGGSLQNVPGVASMFSQVTGIPKLSRAISDPAPNRNDPSGTATSIAPLPAIAGGFGNSPMNALVNNTTNKEEVPGKKPPEPNVNQRSVIADPRQNAVIVRDSSQYYDNYRQLINYMDQSSPMIQIDAYIIDLQKNEATNLGFGLSWSAGSYAGTSVNPGAAPIVSPNIILNSTQGAQLLARISALETRGLSQVVSVPTVLALNNLEAVFSTRQSFYVPVQGNQDASLTSITASTFLKVTPMFTNEGESDDKKRIKMILNVQDSAVDNALSTQVSGLPQVTENQIATQAVVNNGDTLVIGGQVVRKVLDSDSGFPFLSRLPVIGLLFSQRSRQYQEFLRIYVISPRLLGEDSRQAAQSSSNQTNGSITSNKMLQEELPKVIQGTSLPSNPDVKLAPEQKQQDFQNSIFTAVPTI
jgi:hypothetical protein